MEGEQRSARSARAARARSTTPGSEAQPAAAPRPPSGEQKADRPCQAPRLPSRRYPPGQACPARAASYRDPRPSQPQPGRCSRGAGSAHAADGRPRSPRLSSGPAPGRSRRPLLKDRQAARRTKPARGHGPPRAANLVSRYSGVARRRPIGGRAAPGATLALRPPPGRRGEPGLLGSAAAGVWRPPRPLTCSEPSSMGPGRGQRKLRRLGPALNRPRCLSLRGAALPLPPPPPFK
ncbi:hypothetical protein LTLLF_182465 [Microtus ochrogaster]|uniref:Uncharacterized protein n=1 Tax=Microtus ochrogaster TaxID=79684 RepID=A0A8J6G246_MICOH|nr:hypothetical protein LTLLF_182465 [Microtus ochrogaster]